MASETGGGTVTTRVVLIRHGETDWNRDRRIQGQTDTPLSALGRRQALAIGQRLKRERFTAI
ncbi:MAG: histidine phosphatase family protein, partial [bacterium]